MTMDFTSLPSSTKLSDWLNPDLVKSVSSGDLSAFCVDEPYTHFAIANFFQEKILKFERKIFCLATIYSIFQGK